MKHILILLALLMFPATASAQLLYPAPVLSAPTTITLGNGPTVTKLDPRKDYIIQLPKVKKRGSTQILGGHHITIIGGLLSVPKGDETRRALYIKDATGTVHIEGLRIDVSDAEADGIVIAAPLATVQIQNVRIVGVHGFLRTWHADVVQPWGGAKRLLIDNMTAYSAYQGLQFTALKGPIGEVRFSRINLVSIGKQVWTKGANGGNGGFLMYFTCSYDVPTTLTDVYVQQRVERGPEIAVYPPADNSTKCRSTLNKTRVSFTGLPSIVGHVTVGRKADYVPAKSVGLGYVAK